MSNPISIRITLTLTWFAFLFQYSRGVQQKKQNVPSIDQSYDLLVNFSPYTFVPHLLLDVPSFCSGSKNPCYRKCTGIYERDDLFVCFFLAHQQTGDFTTLGVKRRTKFTFRNKVINITTNPYRPDTIAKKCEHFCKANEIEEGTKEPRARHFH